MPGVVSQTLVATPLRTATERRLTTDAIVSASRNRDTQAEIIPKSRYGVDNLTALDWGLEAEAVVGRGTRDQGDRSDHQGIVSTVGNPSGKVDRTGLTYGTRALNGDNDARQATPGRFPGLSHLAPTG